MTVTTAQGGGGSLCGPGLPSAPAGDVGYRSVLRLHGLTQSQTAVVPLPSTCMDVSPSDPVTNQSRAQCIPQVSVSPMVNWG